MSEARSASPKSDLTDTFKIGENDMYRFGVGKVGNRWVGFALGDLENGDKAMFLLPGISEGFEMGLPDRDKAILMTGAIAQDPEHGYGGIDRWFVDEPLRGNPEDFRCKECGMTGCDGEHYSDDWEMLGDEDL